MKSISENMTEIKVGLSKKKVFRVLQNNISRIVIDFSNEQNEFQNFLNVYNILKKINISTPQVYEIHSKKKLIIMEDFGDNTFDKLIQKKNLYTLLKLAVDNLILIQNSITKDYLVKLNKYTFTDLKNEISEFVNYYIPFKKISNFPVDDFYNSWKNAYDKQHYDFNSFSHKDFEFINLIYLHKRKLNLKCGIIDFQSAFIGFNGWDLFSILENPRIDFTRRHNEDLLKYFYDKVEISTDFNLFRHQYYLLNLSRQSRLLGRWVKLFSLGKKKYLKYIDVAQKRLIISLNNIEESNLKEIYKNYLKINV